MGVGRMIYRFSEIVSGAVPNLLVGKKRLANIKRAVFYRLGAYWHRELRPKHFTVAGGREYHYAPRQGETGADWKRSYTGIKFTAKGHRKPLVYSGESERESRAARIVATSTSTRSSVRVTMQVPKLNYKGGGIDMAEELRTISAKEEDDLTRMAEADLVKEFNRINARLVLRH